MNRSIRIVLVDDHAVVREGLAAVLGRCPDLEVVGEAGSAAQAVEVAGRTQPDVVVMDIRMPGGSGIDACREITSRWPEVRILVLTSYADDEAVLASIAAGASGYVLKQVGSQGLVEAIRRVAAGESLLDPSVTGQVLAEVRRAAAARDPELALLNDQERKILGLIAAGKTNREIATAVYLSEKTVRNYVSGIFTKLNLANRAEAAAFAARKGLRPDPSANGTDKA
ncbi:MAG: response regulator transcription factor [Bacillota bacterium]|nr:response regulator transcription factor [Bacillota bacterium]